MIELIEQYREAVEELCRRHQVCVLEVFGSAATGEFDPGQSDLDFLVDFLPLEPGHRAKAYFGLWFGLEDLFSARVFSEDSPRKKPHPAPLQTALKLLRAKPEECVYVGDSAEDIEMARRAGVRAIGVLGPFPTARRIRAAEPDLLLRSIRDLPRHLRRAG